LSTHLKYIFIILICSLFLSFGCATRPPIIVKPPEPAQEPAAPPRAQKPVPAPPAPEKAEPEKVETVPPEPVPPEQPAPRSTVPGTGQPDRSSPRTVASLRLTEQARILIETKKPDEAISILEKAMNINTNNGENYYFLAEAWIMKGNKEQALEFNRMAGLYLKNNAEWNMKVRQQKERIGKMKSPR